MFGYNDMNTYTPNPFAVNDMIRMSGAGRKPKGIKLGWIQNEKIKTGRYIPPEVLEMMKNSKRDMGVNDFVKREREMNKKLKPKGKYELFGAGMDSDDEDMDGVGFFDEVKKGYSKAKGAVKSKTGKKIKGALMEEKAFMKEFNKVKKQLSDYQRGLRKTKPGKAVMAILEKLVLSLKLKMNLEELVIKAVKYQEYIRLKNGVILLLVLDVIVLT
jgi:hypothetical protein